MAKGGLHGKGRPAWQRGPCMVKGGGVWQRGHAWQGGMCGGGYVWQGGHVWQGVACVAGRHAWQERLPLQQTVRILLQCILVYYCVFHFLVNNRYKIFLNRGGRSNILLIFFILNITKMPVL